MTGRHPGGSAPGAATQTDDPAAPPQTERGPETGHVDPDPGLAPSVGTVWLSKNSTVYHAERECRRLRVGHRREGMVNEYHKRLRCS